MPASPDRIEEAIRAAFRRFACQAHEASTNLAARKEPPAVSLFQLEGNVKGWRPPPSFPNPLSQFNSSILDVVAAELSAELEIKGDQQVPFPVVLALRSHFLRAQSLRLVVPGNPDGRYVFGGIQGDGQTPFSFTDIGLSYYMQGLGDLGPAGSLAAKLRAVRAANSLVVTEEQIVVLDEAQHCWSMSCYRAAMILIGVASEDALSGLADDLNTSYSSVLPVPGLPKWKDLAPGQTIGKRMDAAFEALRAMNEKLRKTIFAHKNTHGSFPPWSSDLQSPDALQGIAEAIRQSRNEAAHDPLSTSAAGDVTLLLSSMPALLEKVAGIRSFLRTPPVPLPPLP